MTMTTVPLDLEARQHRLGLLRAVGLGLAVAFPVFFALLVVRDTGGPLAIAWALGPGVAVGAALALSYRHRPPVALPLQEGSEEPDAAEDDGEDDAEDDGRWTPGPLVAAVVGVIAIVVIGVLVRFFVPLAIVIGVGLATPGASIAAIVLAAGCSLALLAGFEFGVEQPLLRRWGIDPESPARAREDHCPPSSGPGA